MASLNLDLSFKQTQNNNSEKLQFTYKDVSFNFANTSDELLTANITPYGFKELNDYESVMNGIRNIFLWHKGQRILLPEFGSSLRDHLYETVNEINAQNIAFDIKSSIEKWEPRVQLTSTNVIPDPDNNQYNVEIQFFIPTISTSKNLSYKLNLQGLI